MRKSKLTLCLGTAAITLSAVVFMAACHKASTATTEDTSYASDQANADKTYDDAQSVADEAATTPNGSMAYRTTATTGSACATVTHAVVTTGTYSGDSLITIDFGTTDCLCNDGSYRKGQILVYYSGAYAASGSTHTITFNNFYQNDNQVEGTKTVTNMGLNSSNQIYFDVSINGSIILANGAGTISGTWTRVRTWITEGAPSVYQITGSGSITSRKGVTVATDITFPLVVATNCRWIEAGTVSFTLPSGLTRTLNYGNTAVCDDEAVLTLATGATLNITLP